jgi:acetyl-CoA synthetase
MPWNPIIKSRRDWETIPNLYDYESVRKEFSWEQARAELDGLPEGQGLNIAHEAVVRHATGSLGQQTAIRWLGKSGQVEDYSYARLDDLTNRFANALQGLGVVKGDRVFVLAGRIPELYIAALGTLKHRALFCPLFSAFGPEPIRARLTIGQAKVLVTTESLYQRKVAGIRETLPHLEHVLLIGDEATSDRHTRDAEFS